MAVSPYRNVYKRHTRLLTILDVGWAMGLLPEQTLREASNAGYARCVVEPALHREWARLDAEYQDYCDNHPHTFEPIELD